ncbi:MAG TPA: hypothetical protein VH277_02295 [Gemmatimonadaceae bacterium]|jgi:hypothetical protein|nr:hypothetical protein [Gemmatimonadaceae bacterium]
MRTTRKSLLGACAAVAMAAGVGPVGAQQAGRPSGERQSVPQDVRRDVIDLWNAAGTLRSSERTEIDEHREINGAVAVLRGPLIVAGHVMGSVVAINSDVILRPTARIDGNLLVFGGDVEGISGARVDGRIRIFRQSLTYREEGDRMIAIGDDSTHDDESLWRRFERRRANTWYETLRIVQAGPYNRVEGLPIEIGPALTERTPWGSVGFNAAGIIRTGSSFNDERGDVGDNLRTEVRIGHDFGIGVGGRLFSVVDPIEGWQLSDLETALAAFVARRDYRDYYQRHGGKGYVTLFGARNFSFTGSYGQERWASRELRNPLTIFNGERPWRPNPLVDEGLFHIADLALRFDTRTDPDDPWSGWYLNSDVEHGSGTYSSVAPTSSLRPALNAGTDYLRGFFDARRYNRLGPSAQLNVRVVLGGWLGGDQLPIERRLSVDGPGTLPGFGFREFSAGPDVGTCTSGLGINGMAAECDRIALAQIEYRGDLKVDFTGDWEDWPRHYRSAHGDITWVFFADAGRGWKVGAPDGTMTYGSGSFPSLSSFRSDAGVGLDIAGIGLYAAKAVSTWSEPMNFFVRLRHRF